MRSVILGLALILSGCGASAPPIRADQPPSVPSSLPTPLPAPEAPKLDKSGKVDPLAQAKYDDQRYTETAGQAHARYEILKQQYADDSLRSQTMWITGLCLLLAAICGVAAFIVPIGKSILVSAAIGFTVVAACAQAFQWAVPYLPWIGGTMLVGVGIWAAFHGKKIGNAAVVAAQHGDRIENWIQDLPDDMRVKANKIIEDVKTETKQQAVALGVDNPLQALRGKLPSLWQRLFP